MMTHLLRTERFRQAPERGFGCMDLNRGPDPGGSTLDDAEEQLDGLVFK